MLVTQGKNTEHMQQMQHKCNTSTTVVTAQCTCCNYFAINRNSCHTWSISATIDCPHQCSVPRSTAHSSGQCHDRLPTAVLSATIDCTQQCSVPGSTAHSSGQCHDRLPTAVLSATIDYPQQCSVPR